MVILVTFLALASCAASPARQAPAPEAEAPPAPEFELPTLQLPDDKFIGNILSSGRSDDPRFAQLWNQVTPENAAKWGSVEASQDSMNWSNLDRAYEFAKSNGYPIRLHTLVWGQQQPEWINSLPRDEQLAEVEEWIAALAERYPDVEMIDVVNEPLHALPAYMFGLGGPGATSWDWVIKTFELARQYFPTALLKLNDYGILGDPDATGRYLNIIRLLQERDLIDGIGVQAHFLEDSPAATVSSNLDRLAETGLPIYITEFDLNISNDSRQARKMAELFPLFVEHPAVAGITLWGYEEGRIWREDGYLIRRSGEPRPALLWMDAYLRGEEYQIE